MKNLGKIVLLIFLTTYTVLADVRATVDATSVEEGEMVTYSLHLSGSDIVRPKIQVLCGVDVISTSSQTSIEMINGDISRKNTLSYKFVPEKSCKIEPMEVEIGGKIQKSNSVEIKVVKAVANKDSDFILTLETKSKEVYVGEPFEVSLIFKQRRDAQAVDSNFTPPKLNGFWIKEETKPTTTQENNYNLTKITYTMAAQRVGSLKITKAKMRIASRSHTRDSWGSWVPKIKWKTYYSNELSIDVKALPSGVGLVGNFSLMASVDRQSINASEAVKLKLEVLGDGNLEDIKSFKPYIDGVNVFDEKIVVNKNRLTQKLVFVADKSFTIPSFELKYFDPTTKEIKTTSTNPIEIEVKNAKEKKELVIKREEIKKVKPALPTLSTQSISYSLGLVIFALGVLVGVLIMLFKPYKIFFKEKTLSIKEPKVLLAKLLPYKNDSEVEKIIEILEDNIYSDAKRELDKKAIKEILKRYKIT